MHYLLNFLAVVFCVLLSIESNANDAVSTFQTQITRYVQETHASVIERRFETHYQGELGVSRPVINVSRSSFATFARYLQSDNVFYLFHEPFQHVIIGAYGAHKGTFGRFEEPFNFTASGAMLIPILLSNDEVTRLQQYLRLAAAVPRREDVASFPWLLRTDSGEQYGPTGDINSFSEWFARMPIGTDLDEQETRPAYSVINFAEDIKNLVRTVWSAPHSHQSLRQMLNLQRFRDDRDLDTPGLIASAVMANTTIERVPAVFRFANDHRQVQPADFSNYFDVDYNPNQTQQTRGEEFQ